MAHPDHAPRYYVTPVQDILDRIQALTAPERSFLFGSALPALQAHFAPPQQVQRPVQASSQGEQARQPAPPPQVQRPVQASSQGEQARQPAPPIPLGTFEELSPYASRQSNSGGQ
jgi:hypothetical protein